MGPDALTSPPPGSASGLNFFPPGSNSPPYAAHFVTDAEPIPRGRIERVDGCNAGGASPSPRRRAAEDLILPSRQEVAEEPGARLRALFFRPRPVPWRA